MGVNPMGAPTNVIIGVWPWGAYLGADSLEKGVRDEDLVVGPSPPELDADRVQDRRRLRELVPGQARSGKAGYDEAIMLGTDGLISECTGENLFIVRDGLIISPPTVRGRARCAASPSRAS